MAASPYPYINLLQNCSIFDTQEGSEAYNYQVGEWFVELDYSRRKAEDEE